ncbi:SulP family sulfate permease [Catalinimonas alkaloidigena]|uniref:SulP family inorganic anion transporter n=1 Tax=Catalinimonas alkaloidigena TaxID=1075417 RepID=UPI002406B337|nr:solute carrier family 26 protein [Catalinimonas alkaloidigena]MDF9798816.1 SulP family sulfate permease [Catalinimonas alkaloidigena]
MKLIQKVLPITNWLPAYKNEYLKGDIFAGITVGIMLIPQGMAYALIAGLPPVYGLYASIVPQIIYAIFGTSRQLSVAPVAMDSLLVAAGVSVLATQGTDAYIGFAILLAFFMGAFQLLLGVLRLGFITNLLSKPVISGFTSAAALIIGLNQLKYLLGIELVKSNRVYEILWSAIQQIDHIHWFTLLIGIAGIALIKGAKKIHKNIPGALVAVVFGTLLVYFMQLNEAGVSIVKTIPEGLPAFQLPNLSLGKLGEIVPLALTISVVAFMEAYSVAKAIEAKKRDYKVLPNQELVALGAANVVGSLFQAYPVTGGFSRSAVNYQSGANTPIASIISAALVALTLMFLTPLFYYLPEAILASVIMVAVAGLIDISYARKLWKDSKMEFLLLLATFLVTLNFSMVPGIVTGVVLSILVLLYKAAYPHIARLGRVKGYHEFRNITRFKELEVWENLLILRVDAPLTFINIQYFKEYVENAIQDSEGKIDTVILDAGPISHLDATASLGLKELLEFLKEKDIRFVLCDLIGPVRDTLHRTGLIDFIGKDNIFFDLNEAVRFITTQEGEGHKEYALQSNHKK